MKDFEVDKACGSNGGGKNERMHDFLCKMWKLINGCSRKIRRW
jgi:hypothetical protein